MLLPAEIAADKVAIYIRWSTDDQGEGTTLQTQLERCQHYLRSQGWQYRDDLVYVDDGYSGGSLDRPALTRLRRDVASGQVQCVVVYKIDRLSRSVVDIVDLVLRDWEGRCYIKSTTEEVNTLTPAGKMFFYILVSFAEYERSIIRERTLAGKIKRAEQGLNPGFRPPYGYTRGAAPGSFAVVEHEAVVVRSIFDRYRLGSGVQAIAQALNEGQVLHRERPWTALAVRRVLGNPAYAGVLEYGRSTRTTREQRERQGAPATVRFGRPRYARVVGALPALVERPVWAEVQQLLAGRRPQAGSKPTYSDYLLSGVAVCTCGAPLGGKQVGGRAYYYCGARKRQGKGACSAGHIPAGPVEAALAQRVRDILRRLCGDRLLPRLQEAVEQQAAEVRAQAAATEAERPGLEARRHRLERDYRRGELPARLYTEELASIDREQGALEQRLLALRARAGELAQAPGALLEALNELHPWELLTVPEQKQLLRALAGSVTVYRRAGSQEPPMVAVEWIRLP